MNPNNVLTIHCDAPGAAQGSTTRLPIGFASGIKIAGITVPDVLSATNPISGDQVNVGAFIGYVQQTLNKLGNNPIYIQLFIPSDTLAEIRVALRESNVSEDVELSAVILKPTETNATGAASHYFAYGTGSPMADDLVGYKVRGKVMTSPDPSGMSLAGHGEKQVVVDTNSFPLTEGGTPYATVSFLMSPTELKQEVTVADNTTLRSVFQFTTASAG